MTVPIFITRTAGSIEISQLFHTNSVLHSYPSSEATYETVGPKEFAALSDLVAMETTPACASVH